MIPRRYSPRKLDIDLALRITGQPNAFSHVARPFCRPKWQRQTYGHGTPFQASHMRFQLKRHAVIRADHLVHPVPELIPTILHWNHGFRQRHEPAVQKADVRHHLTSAQSVYPPTRMRNTRRSSAVNFHPMRFSNTSRCVPGAPALNSNVRCPESTALPLAVRRKSSLTSTSDVWSYDGTQSSPRVRSSQRWM